MKEKRMALVLIGCVILLVSGCSNKGDRAGKVEVVLTQRLQEKGVSLVDWRFTDSTKTFGVKLKTTQPLDKQTYLVISGPGVGSVSSPIPVGEAINKGEWLDFGGTKAFGNPFENFPQTGTITIGVR